MERDAALDATLLDLALLGRTHPGGAHAFLDQIARRCVGTLGVDRVSIWRLSSSLEQMACVAACAPLDEAGVRVGQILEAADYPVYFAAIRAERCLSVEDAHEHPATRAMLGGYLLPERVGAMLDAPIFIGDRFAGVLCAETAQRHRSFSVSEMSFWAATADLAAVALADEEAAAARARAEQSELLLRTVLDDLQEYVIRTRSDGTVTFANRLAASLADGDWRGRKVLDFVMAEDRGIVLRAVASLDDTNCETSYENRVVTPAGLRLVRWTLRRLGPNELQATGHDVTELREHQRQIREAERMNALAVFSAGIAHDFNNLLAPIVAFASLRLDDDDLPPDLREDLRSIHHAGRQAAELVRQMLLFARHDDGPAVTLDLGQSLREALRFVRAGMPTNIDVECVIEGDLGSLVGRPTDVFRVISNLATNALQAMPAGGRLRVVASRTGPETAEILVGDTGVGIAPELLGRVFEPLFTTKAARGGSGLGLSVVHGTIERLGGAVDVQSTIGAGTTFVLRLPVRTPDPREHRALATAAEARHRRILVIDDDAGALAATCALLTRSGHAVVPCSSANVALESLTVGPAFDLVVCDQTMPVLGGVEFAWRLMNSAPGLPVVIVSGFTVGFLPSALPANVVGVLRKPLDAVTLAGTIADAFEAARDRKTGGGPQG